MATGPKAWSMVLDLFRGEGTKSLQRVAVKFSFSYRSFSNMLIGIYLSECYLRGIYKSPTALFRIKKSETAPKSKELNSPTCKVY
jgi:hypothetical protein